MKLSLMDTYSDKDFETIVKNSYSYADCMKNLGYNAASGNSLHMLKKKIERMEIDTTHFETNKPQRIKRTRENVFIENGDCCGSTVRLWFLKEPIEYKCSICGQEPFWNGKEMTLIMDHINGNNKDHRLENLRWVCPNCNQQLETTNGKNKKARKYDITTCIDCGKQISRGTTRCRSCLNKKHKIARAQMQQYVIKQPQLRLKPNRDNTITDIPQQNFKFSVSYNELKELIRNKSFLQIGKQFNVSDNAIRKRCELFGLPSKSSEIKSFTNEEWEQMDGEFFIYKIIDKETQEIFVISTTISDLYNDLNTHKTFILDKINSNYNNMEINKKEFDIFLVETALTFQDIAKKEKYWNNFLGTQKSNTQQIEYNENDIIVAYKELGVIKKVCEKLNFCEQTVRKVLRKNNIEIKTSKEYQIESFGVPVKQLSINGKYIRTFDTIGSAAQFLVDSGKTDSRGSANSGIVSACKNKKQTSYGYRWEYVDITRAEKTNSVSWGNTVICMETGEMFKSYREAERKTGISADCIMRSCKDNKHSAGGYHWKQINKETLTSEEIEEIKKEALNLPTYEQMEVKKVKCIETGIIYDNMAIAKKETGANRYGISLCCRGMQETAGGFHWEYATPKKENTSNA